MNIRPLIGVSLLHRPLSFLSSSTQRSSFSSIRFPSAIPSHSLFSASSFISPFPLSSFVGGVRYYRPTPPPYKGSAQKPSNNPPQQNLREIDQRDPTIRNNHYPPVVLNNSVVVDGKEEKRSGASLAEEVETLGAAKFLRQVYTTTGIGIGGSFALAYALSMTAPLASIAMPLAIGGGLLSIASIIAMSFTKHSVKQSPEGHYYSEQSIGRKIAYAGLSVGNGLVIAPLFQIASVISPALLPLATLLSITTMGASSLYAYSRPAASLSVMRTTLVSTLAGFVAMGLLSIGSTLIIGPNMFSSMWYTIDTYGGILLFSAFTAYDTYMAVERYRNRDPDHIMTATSFFLDFMNLFVRFVEIFGKRRD